MEVEETVASDELKQFIVVRLGIEQYGIHIQYVQNIVRMMHMTRVPKAKHYIKGVVNLRGEIIPVMSVRLKFNLEDDVLCDETRIIFVEVDGNEIGLIVDEVKEVILLSGGNIDIIHKDPEDEEDNYVYGVGKVGDALVTLLNVEELIKVQESAEG